MAACHAKIKDCDEFLQLHAARKKAYIATDYFREQIEAVKATGEEGWEMQVKALEGMLKQQEAVRQGIAGTVGTEDVEAATIARSYSGFKGEF